MRKRVIKAFLAATTVICIIYGNIRYAYHSLVAYKATTISNNVSVNTTSQGSTISTSNDKSTGNGHAIKNSTTADKPTLSEYLSKLRCGGCSFNCLLSNPGCLNGATKAADATTDYQKIYGN